MPATGWEKFEILAAELRALRAENERLEGLVSKWEANYDEGIKAQFERAKAHLAFSSIGIDRDDVDALVKAARALVDAYDKHDYAGGNGPALAHEVNAVCDALKPFEE
jgi:phage head maturation protease